MKTELVFKSEKGTPITNSLLVAEKFGRRHSDVLRSIENVIEQSIENQAQRHYALSEYQDITGKLNPMYVMTKDGFSVLVMGFTGEKALQFKWTFMEAFNKMEQTIKSGGFQIPSTFKEALLLAVKQQELIEEKERLIAEQKPAVTFMNAVTGSTTNILMRDMAKLLSQNGINIGEVRLYEWLTHNKYLIRTQRWSNSKQRYDNSYMPSQRASDLKIFYVSMQAITVGEHSFTRNTVKITPKGQAYFINMFLKKQKEA